MDVPESVRVESTLISKIERYNAKKRDPAKKISLFGRRGYDIIRNRFFAEFYSASSRKTGYFSNFDDYYNALNGEIYVSACYFQYCFSDEEIEKYSIDMQRVNFDGLVGKKWKTSSRRLKKEERARVRKGYKYSTDSFYAHICGAEDGSTETLLHVDFDFFFDFVSYFDGDLSDADLLLCDGIINLTNTDGLRFDRAHLTTAVRKKLGLTIESTALDLSQLREFELTVQNEEQTQQALTNLREDEDLGQTDIRICYISDLHLMHQIESAGCTTEDDARYYVMKEALAIAEELQKYNARFLLIAGDISTNFEIYTLFIRSLKCAISSVHTFPFDTLVTLGNHELWAFPDLDFASIVEKYRAVLKENRMCLLQNDLYYQDMTEPWHLLHFSESDIVSMSSEEINSKLAGAQMIIFGGLGFSGRNEEFNANNGIYLSILGREEEIAQSERIAKLYEKVCSSTQNHTLIVCTHCPVRDWIDEKRIAAGIYHVSGHTHKNYYVEDDAFHLYEDNQIGYHSHHLNHLKYFNANGAVDIFADWEDGIHIISPKQYVDFNLGKKIRFNCKRDHIAIFMLKKYGYYMFVMYTTSRHLCIMNGGSIKKLPNESLFSLYERMDSVIAKLKDPMDLFTMMQNRVASAVRKIGGTGYIHGCIVDIDYWNHIYVNPMDTTIHGYYAFDMRQKYFYESIPALLYQNCPEMYSAYCKLLGESKGKEKNTLAILGNMEQNLAVKPTAYYGTEMYGYSRRIKKFQKLNSNILSEWIAVEDYAMLTK